MKICGFRAATSLRRVPLEHDSGKKGLFGFGCKFPYQTARIQPAIFRNPIASSTNMQAG